MKKILLSMVLTLVLLVSCVQQSIASSFEKVYVQKVMNTDYKAIIERANGDTYLIEYGIGVLSFWRYEGKYVYIDSPGMFAGIGSKVILPDANQSARIWDSELISSTIPISPRYQPASPIYTQSSPVIYPISILVNGSPLPGNVYLENNVLMIPLGSLAYMLGAELEWDNNYQFIFVKKPPILTALTFNGCMALTGTSVDNGRLITINPPPHLIEDKVYIPLYVVEEVFGVSVNRDYNANVVTINSI